LRSDHHCSMAGTS